MRINALKTLTGRLLINALVVLSIVIVCLFFWLGALPKTLFHAPVSSIILDRDDKLLGAHIASDQQWRFPPILAVPEKFATCLIEFEDKRFRSHIGVDPLAMARAMKMNLMEGRIVSGGSTLSMQVIRLAQNNPPRTLFAKLKESFMAMHLELAYSKDDILKLYASHAPFGGNIVGLEAASWRYFGRKPEQLSWAESATLAVLPNSPALIHPGRQRDQLKAKRDRLLLRLKEKGILPDLDYQLALSEPLPTRPHGLPRLAPHLLDSLIARYRSKRFNTTLDRNLQQNITNVARLHAGKLQLEAIHNLAVLVIDNRNFNVIAYVGNASDEQTGPHGYSIDLIDKPRSTGSTLKPFLFANMIQSGELLPESLVADVPIRYPGFSPQNYDRQFRGAVRAKEALASSLNIPAANMLSQYGVGRFQDDLKSMGMAHLYRHAKNYGLTLILGGAEGTLWELTSLYANLAKLANQDLQSQDPFWYQPVLLQGKEPRQGKKAGISTATAWMTLQALLEVTRPGTDGYWQKFSSSRPIAWKTGTSFGQRDAWAIGVTPEYTVGVWAGNANGTGVAGLTGTNSAAPILFDAFNQLPYSNKWFSKPHWQMKKVTICRDDGYLAQNNCATTDYDVPINSFFDKISPFHPLVHVDATENWQVHNGCESIYTMNPRHWFVLPADQAFYFQQHNADYKPLPPFRPDCSSGLGSTASVNPITLIYPQRGTHIYIPVELDGKPGKVVFRAMHQNPDQQLFWHIDNHFVGTTQTFHQQAVWIEAGSHVLTLVDGDGNRIEQTFSVIARE